MAKRKRVIKRFRRNRLRRRLRKAGGRIARPLPSQGLPPRKLVKMKYQDYKTFTLNVGSNWMGADTWSLNSIYDPYVATGGHQPRSHDQWKTLYRKYCVIRGRVKIDIPAISTAYDNQPLIISTRLTDDNSAISSGYWYDYVEPKKCYSKFGAVYNAKQIIRKWNMKRMVGCKNIMDEGNWHADFGNNPTYQKYLVVDTLGTVDTTFTIMLSFTYYVVLYNPVSLGAS